MKINDDNLEYENRRTAQDFYNEDPQGFDIAQKMLYNENADRSLLRKYKSEFGENAPRNLSELQEMKYRNPKEWHKYKIYLRSIRSGELTALADFELYKSISKNIDDKLIGITTSNGIKITGKSDHFIARCIGSVEQRRDGVKIEDIFDALTSIESDVFSIVTSKKGNASQKFRGLNVDATVNPNTGILIQTNPHSAKGKKTND